MRIISFNIWKNSPPFEKRMAIIAEELLNLNPDIILLQEVFSINEDTHNSLNFITDKRGILSFHTPSRFKKRIHNKISQDSFSGFAICHREKVIESFSMILPTTPLDGERRCQFLIIDRNNRKICFVNSHLTHIENAVDVRLQQISSILDKLSTFSSLDHIFWAGDFNCTYGSSEIKNILNDERFKFYDTFSNSIPIKHRSTLNTASKPIAIDFIFHSSPKEILPINNASIHTVDRDQVLASDHNALILDVNL